ncbi:MAG TPA: hypothetical protein VFW40_06560 [Capsulimonadaceae bacterium]|nr:hypothetical protein [Capsulimonadaceae bacterium]
MQTIYASFADASLAEKAAGALLDYGAKQEDLSLVTNDRYGETRVTEGRAIDEDAVNRNFQGNWGGAASNSTQSAGDRIAQAGDRTMAAASGAVGADNAAANYNVAADDRAARADIRADEASADTGYRGGVAAPDRPVTAVPANNTIGAPNPGVAYTDTTVPADDDVVDRSTLDTENRGTESAAKHGISTTTAGDAESGALKGAGWGLGLGIIGIIASLAVPGVGWVAGGGALATAIGGAIGTTVGGAIAGGVTGYLKDQGVPDQVAMNYSKDIENGGALLAVTVPSNNVDAGTAEQILGKYGAANISSY